jgi:hypothetical protein
MLQLEDVSDTYLGAGHRWNPFSTNFAQMPHGKEAELETRCMMHVLRPDLWPFGQLILYCIWV